MHRGKNLTGDTVVTAQTFIVPAGTPTSQSTVQLCGVPLSVDDSKNLRLDEVRASPDVPSQGDCQQYVITGR